MNNNHTSVYCCFFLVKRNSYTCILTFYAFIFLSATCKNCKKEDCLIHQDSKKPPAWWPSSSKAASFSNVGERCTAMRLFAIGLRIGVRKGIFQKDVSFITRAYKNAYTASDIKMFPQCIQDQLESWYPLPVWIVIYTFQLII